jgi:hypothetical protein
VQDKSHVPFQRAEHPASVPHVVLRRLEVEAIGKVSPLHTVMANQKVNSKLSKKAGLESELGIGCESLPIYTFVYRVYQSIYGKNRIKCSSLVAHPSGLAT